MAVGTAKNTLCSLSFTARIKPCYTLLLVGTAYKCRGVAQPGSALPWGGRGRLFKSSRPDQSSLEQLVASGSSSATVLRQRLVIDERLRIEYDRFEIFIIFNLIF